MRQQLRRLREMMVTSVWILPMLMGGIGLAGAAGALWADRSFPIPLGEWIPAPEAVRAALTTAAGGVIGLAGVSVSMAMVALSLAAGQFGPKLLRHYLTRWDQKVVLGIFMAAFLFNLAALAGTSVGTPAVTLTLFLSALLTLTALAGFIVFVHQIASSLHADHVIALIGADLEGVLDHMLEGEPADGEDDGRDSRAEWEGYIAGLGVYACTVEQTGYVDAIEYRSLAELASQRELALEVLVTAGDFVLPESPLARIHTIDRPDDETIQAIRGAVLVGRQPTPVQDVGFPILQMIQIAARALSPGINDPPTAIACVDWLSAALARAARSDLPKYQFRDEDGKLRVRGHGTDFASMMGAAFNPLRQYAHGNVEVILRCLEAMKRLVSAARGPDRLDVIAEHVERFAEEHGDTFQTAADRTAFDARIGSLREAIAGRRHSSS